MNLKELEQHITHFETFRELPVEVMHKLFDHARAALVKVEEEVKDVAHKVATEVTAVTKRGSKSKQVD
jgi:hypothetical protein